MESGVGVVCSTIMFCLVSAGDGGGLAEHVDTVSELRAVSVAGEVDPSTFALKPIVYDTAKPM